ncbi:MAG: DUF2254 domain-containing protein [Pseudomonadales bacterium]
MRQLRNRRRGRRQRNTLWIAPVVSAAIAAVVAALALLVDARVEWEQTGLPVFVGEPDTARMMLSIIGGSVTTLLALIFTVIAVVIQLAIGQYTPRALTILLGDRPSHFTIGVFVGTFTYSLIVLVFLHLTFSEAGSDAGSDAGSKVSGLAVTLAFALAVVTIATFAVYSNHIIHAVRASSIIGRIGRETRSSIERLYRPFGDPPEPEPQVATPALPLRQTVLAAEPGVLVDVDEDALYAIACAADAVLVFVPPVGAFVPEGAPLVRVYGAAAASEQDLHNAVEFGDERNLLLDVSFGLRQLVDIAARALSPGINDPATAVQVIDQVHDLLRRLLQRRLTDGSRWDDDGNIRLVLRMSTWEQFVTMTLDELRRFGHGSLAVMRRLRALLEDLLIVAPEFRRASLRLQIELLDQACDSGFDNARERDLARRSDLRGAGF